MHSFPVPVLRPAVGFLSPFPDSLPQLFLRCLPYALAFGLSPFLPLPFVRFRSGSGYSASVSSFPFLPVLCLTVASSGAALPLSLLRFSPFRSARFPVLPFRFFVLSFLPVSFRPSQFRSRSRSTGACLLLSLSAFPLLFRWMISASFPVLTTQPLRFLFSSSRSPLAVVPPVPVFPFRESLFPCLPSGSDTQLAAFPFSVTRLTTQRLPRAPDLSFRLSASSP